jgi:DNA-binding transcriptional regulator YdaS (Cro superfamily)
MTMPEGWPEICRDAAGAGGQVTLEELVRKIDYPSRHQLARLSGHDAVFLEPDKSLARDLRRSFLERPAGPLYRASPQSHLSVLFTFALPEEGAADLEERHGAWVARVERQQEKYAERRQRSGRRTAHADNLAADASHNPRVAAAEGDAVRCAEELSLAQGALVAWETDRLERLGPTLERFGHSRAAAQLDLHNPERLRPRVVSDEERKLIWRLPAAIAAEVAARHDAAAARFDEEHIRLTAVAGTALSLANQVSPPTETEVSQRRDLGRRVETARAALTEAVTQAVAVRQDVERHLFRSIERTRGLRQL